MWVMRKKFQLFYYHKIINPFTALCIIFLTLSLLSALFLRKKNNHFSLKMRGADDEVPQGDKKV